MISSKWDFNKIKQHSTNTVTLATSRTTKPRPIANSSYLDMKWCFRSHHPPSNSDNTVLSSSIFPLASFIQIFVPMPLKRFKEIHKNWNSCSCSMNFNIQESHSCSSHTQSFVTHASPYDIHLVHVFSERVQSGQIIIIIATRSRCCFSLSSNKQLRHTPQDSRS